MTCFKYYKLVIFISHFYEQVYDMYFTIWFFPVFRENRNIFDLVYFSRIDATS